MRPHREMTVPSALCVEARSCFIAPSAPSPTTTRALALAMVTAATAAVGVVRTMWPYDNATPIAVLTTTILAYQIGVWNTSPHSTTDGTEPRMRPLQMPRYALTMADGRASIRSKPPESAATQVP